MKVTFPKWHEDARRLREQGHTLGRIVMLLKDAGIEVSESRVSQVTNENWEYYVERDRVRAIAAREEVATAKREGRLPDVKTAVKEASTKLAKEKAMSDRHFEVVTASDPTDVNHRNRISCSHDGCSNALIFVRRGLINPVHAARWFRDKGWHVGNGPRNDLCPDHNPKLAKHANGDAAIQTKHENIQTGEHLHPANVVPAPKPPDLSQLYPDNFNRGPPTAVAGILAAMTRQDRRVIHNKLEDVYVDEFIGYKTSWSDEQVALDLGCEKAWVALVREENFGPELTTARKKADLIKLGDEIGAKVMVMMDGLIPDVKIAIKQYDAMVEEMDARLDRFDADVSALQASLIEFNTKLKELRDDG